MGLKAREHSLWSLAAFVWGFAEAMLFFVIPDVLLTMAALRLGLRPALGLCVVAALGAMVGGLVMWHWGASDVADARHALLGVPALGPDLLARVQGQTRQGWALHLALGPLSGTPYKIYAVEAGAAGVNPFVFAAVSFLARLPRFLLTTSLTAWVRSLLRRATVPLSPYLLLALAWVVNYAIYFYLRR
jgi:membrane protein YqaA with SNARE-associated domain